MSAPQSDWTARLQRWCTEGAELSEQAGNDPEQLLVVLRQLEQLHRDLQDGPFRNSLPSDRHQLYKLLQAMEQNGGWPYIPRLQLKTFMELLEPGSEHDAPDQSALAA